MAHEWYWHVHHDQLFEILWQPIEVRIHWIRYHKPDREVETRLRLMRPVTGPVPQALEKAATKLRTARGAVARDEVARRPVVTYDAHMAGLRWARDVYARTRDQYGPEM